MLVKEEQLLENDAYNKRESLGRKNNSLQCSTIHLFKVSFTTSFNERQNVLYNFFVNLVIKVTSILKVYTLHQVLR